MLLWTLGHMYLFKLLFFFSDNISNRGIAGSYGNSIFTLMRNLYIAFPSDCANSQFHQQYTKLHFSPHPGQHVLIAILTCVRWHLMVVLTYIISDAGNLFMCLLAICISYMEKCLFRFSAHFLTVFFILKCMSYLYILDIDSLVIPFANIFSFSRLSFHFVDSLFCCEKDFKFNLVLFVYFWFLFHCLRRQVQKGIVIICVERIFYVFF